MGTSWLHSMSLNTCLKAPARALTSAVCREVLLQSARWGVPAAEHVSQSLNHPAKALTSLQGGAASNRLVPKLEHEIQ